MNKTTFQIALLSFFILSLSAFAQKKPKKARVIRATAPSSETIYDNFNYIPEIKSVEFYNLDKDQSFPIITLGTSEQVILKFDDLRGGSSSLFYTLEHCDAQWNPSSLSPIDYLESFSEDRINNYRTSFNTYQAYTHYELTLPNRTVLPKISGNYLLKVYEDGDQRKLLLSRRLYVIQQKVQVGAQIVQSNKVIERDRRQKINFTVFHPGLNIQNPYQEVRVLVMQNARSDQSQLTTKPLFVRNNELVYSDLNTNDFPGGNEFRRFDTRSFRFKSQSTATIAKDSLFHVQLFRDPNWNTPSYTSQFDENGKFYIINQDGTDPDFDGDYGYITFTLDAPQPDTKENAYIVGSFNNYQKNEESRMNYDGESKQFYTTMLLKQGVFDYHYTWATTTGDIINDYVFDGSFFETENDYQILVYYKQPGSRFEELVAFTQINSSQGLRRN
jgi:hypothetical protein